MRSITTDGAVRWRLGALLRAAHAPPSLAVTTMATLLGLRAGLDPSRLALVAFAVGTGQFSIGWLNDWWDADHDRAAGRSDKPIVTGAVARASVGVAAILAALLSLSASVALGAAGAVNMVVLAAGWSYDLWAKRTAVSLVPYLLAFGALPAVATLAGQPSQWPPLWMVGAGALLGAGGHFANALPDLEGDRHIGVRGLPQRLGPRLSLAFAATSLGAGTVVAALGALRDAAAGRLLAGAVLVCAIGVLAAVMVTGLRGRLRDAFRLTMVLALLVVTMLLVPA